MKMFLILIAVFSLVSLSLFSAAMAQGRQCLFDGQVYEDGDRVGPYVCVDGEWVLSD
ncbi:hypothetical protein [Ruegeria sp. R14_0]|uniref:hypothetical protein n=1 Tax=Ruegeria sp. R14_0 TaxID=2821100 RepID=UPI001ADC060B|nr:hypothetical protein [Ruegeria sp. R14_0]MBO9448069.1 hypothetical protein [Ruegeria sp. R14_0]